jgi:hypothetical protein
MSNSSATHACVSCYTQIDEKYMYCRECYKSSKTFPKCKGVSKLGNACKIKVKNDYCKYHNATQLYAAKNALNVSFT